MSFTAKNIFELLPAVYRIRDTEQAGSMPSLDKEPSGPLKALIEIIAGQAKLAEKDIARLYNNWFIETCEEWVVPYIGDLLGVPDLHPLPGTPVISQRAYVANTLSYRRRKGIAPVLEQLAQDIAGWRAHVVEFFQLLAATQYMNHVRLHRDVAPDLRRMDKLDLLHSAFDTIAHTADMRQIAAGRGKYNISNIGLFIWRLQGYPVTMADARMHLCAQSPPGMHYFSFDPVGNDIHLFNRPATEKTITHISEEINVPGPLRRRALHDELESRRQAVANRTSPDYIYFDDREGIEGEPATKKHPVFEIFDNNGRLIPPEEILVCNLENCCKPTDAGITVAVDPALGRFIFADQRITKAMTSYAYGFSADVGAGTYNRQASVLAFMMQKIDWLVGVSKYPVETGPEPIYPTIQQAIDEWRVQPPGTIGVITIMDNRSYRESLNISIPEKSQLLIVAATWPGRNDPDPAVTQKWRHTGDLEADGLRPHLQGNISVKGDLADPDKKTGGSLVINGLLIEGRLTIKKGNLGSLSLVSTTLVPAFGGLEAKAGIGDHTSNQWMKILLQKCICGSVDLEESNAVLFAAEDCILDHPAGWAIRAVNTPADLKRSTCYGIVDVKVLYAENCIFNDIVKAARRQTGCIRFSFLPGKNPEVPRRYHCQPEMEINTRIETAGKSGAVSPARKEQIENEVRKWLFPGFNSVRYGHHAYGQLSFGCPLQITTGADNGSEMGVFYFLQQPQRQANLRIALDEYLPLGLQAGIFFVT